MNKLRRALLPRFSVLRTSSLSSSTASASSEPEIIIPDRIPRGPTDILAALAGTVGTDTTAPQYKYHDDPWLIPYKNSMKRDYTLAKEAGRNAARFVLENHPDLFIHNRIRMEPPINAFLPKTRYGEESVTVELLENLVGNFQVEDAMEVHSLLVEKGKELPDVLEQDLMELIAFHNEENPEEALKESEGMIMERKKKGDYGENENPNAGKTNWKSGGLVDQLFGSGEPSPARRIALLLGLARFNMKDRMDEVYKECIEHGDDLPVEVFNEILRNSDVNIGIHQGKEAVKQVLAEMKAKRVAPNLDTIVAILTYIVPLSKFNKGKDYMESCRAALATMAEFKMLGVEPSLGVYKSLLDVFVKKYHKDPSPILKDILGQLEGKNMWPARHKEDFFFFSRAMNICAMMNDSQLAFKVHELLLTGDNLKLVGDWNRTNFYYRDFLDTVLKNEEFSVAIDLYNQVAPHTWCPGGFFFKDLLKQMHNQNGLNHLAKIYSDLRLSDYGGSMFKEQYEITKMLLEILVANDPEKSEYENLGPVYLDIAKKSILELILKKDTRVFSLNVNHFASHICDLVIAVSLREGCFETACQVLDFAVEQRSVMLGSLEEKSLENLARSAMDLGETSRMMEVIIYAAESGNAVALQLANEAVNKLEMNRSQKDLLNKIFLSETKWTSI